MAGHLPVPRKPPCLPTQGQQCLKKTPELTSEVGLSWGLKIQVPMNPPVPTAHSACRRCCPPHRCRCGHRGWYQGNTRGWGVQRGLGWLVRGADIPWILDCRAGLFTPSGYSWFSGLRRELGQFCADSQSQGLWRWTSLESDPGLVPELAV